jgi:hypothetical protein
MKSGERAYDSFQRPGPHRWGDYSGMTIDPDGQTFWYLGEYSKDIINFNPTTWGNYIGSFSFPGCATPQPPGKAISPAPANGSTDVNINADLAWTDNSSGSGQEDEFFIERTTQTGKGSNKTCGDFTNIATVAADTISYRDNKVASRTTYCYRVRGENGVGYGAWSNVATAKSK